MRVLPLLLLMACAANPGSDTRLDRVPNGDWGGQHARLSVEDTGGKVEFDCAHGTLPQPLALDASGRFDVVGTLVAEGGPTPKDETAVTRTARYRGATDGQTMSLEVTLESGESAGTFSLSRGGQPRLFKCR